MATPPSYQQVAPPPSMPMPVAVPQQYGVQQQQHQYFLPAPIPATQSQLLADEPSIIGCGATLVDASNKIYHACYQGMYLFLLVFYVMAVPFIGLAMGAADVTLAIFVRPFCRLVGRMFKDMFWSTNTLTGSLLVQQRQPGDPSPV